jgi:5-methylcytosine-specific restriction endonuclease McrA
MPVADELLSRDKARLAPLIAPPRTRKEAAAAGLKHYFTGKPCHKGHVAPRVLTGTCSECARESVRIWNDANREKISDISRAWHNANRHRRLVELRAWNDANKEYRLEKGRAWRKENSEKLPVYTRNYRARRRSAEGQHTAEDIAAIRVAQRDRCGYCRAALKGKGQVDHIVALNNRGANDRKNLQLLCEGCNKSKSDRDPIEFAQSRGKLL